MDPATLALLAGAAEFATRVTATIADAVRNQHVTDEQIVILRAANQQEADHVSGRLLVIGIDPQRDLPNNGD